MYTLSRTYSTSGLIDNHVQVIVNMQQYQLIANHIKVVPERLIMLWNIVFLFADGFGLNWGT